MSEYGIVVLDLELQPQVTVWLSAYDPDGGDPNVDYPTGHFETTRDPAQALRFPDLVSAWECWRQVSTRTPVRPDGRPNRPLTALTITVEKLP